QVFFVIAQWPDGRRGPLLTVGDPDLPWGFAANLRLCRHARQATLAVRLRRYIPSADRKTRAAFMPPNPNEVESAAAGRVLHGSRRTFSPQRSSIVSRLHVPGNNPRSRAKAVIAASSAPLAPRGCP